MFDFIIQCIGLFVIIGGVIAPLMGACGPQAEVYREVLEALDALPAAVSARLSYDRVRLESLGVY